MGKKHLQRLRKQQRIDLNIFLFLFIGILIGLILLLGATRGDIYELLGIALLLTIVTQWKRKESFFPTFRRMKDLHEWEKEKLGNAWYKYHLPGILLRLFLAVYFFLQAFLYAGKTPFKSEIPFWYLILIPAIFIFVANMNLIFHARRIDTKTTKELKQYCEEKLLFAKIFIAVCSIMCAIGFALVFWLR